MADQSVLTQFDRPNSYVGRSAPRAAAIRHTAGRGRFVDDVSLPRMVHVAFLRSPHAHARIDGIRSEAALAFPGVVAVVNGTQLIEQCSPWVGVLTHLAGLKSAPQPAMATTVACWQGEPVVAVAARPRAVAEDAAETILIDWEPLPVLANVEAALDDDAPASPSAADIDAVPKHGTPHMPAAACWCGTPRPTSAAPIARRRRQWSRGRCSARSSGAPRRPDIR